jgi:cytochrome c553
MKTIHRTIAELRSCSFLPTAAMLVLLAGPAKAADESVKEKAAQCTPCHGETGISQTENTPSLARQPDLYLQWQLIFFRSGSRKIEIMQPIAEQLSNEDVRNLGAYFASLTPPKALYVMPRDTFAGTKAVARLAGQREEYLLKALHDYKSNVRVGGGVAAMADVAYSLSEEEITALAHYLAHL